MIKVFYSLVFLLLPVFFLIMFISWRNSAEGHLRLSFDEFRHYYAIKPERWYLCEDRAEFLDNPSSLSYREVFMETFIDQIRYTFFAAKIQKQKERNKLEAAQKILDKDLRKMEKEY